jgi:hypothetical protein
MKSTNAGFIIGRAIATYANPDPTAVGTVMVYINASWADSQSQPTFNADGDLIIQGVVVAQDVKIGSLADSINDRLTTINNQFANVDNQIASLSAELASLKLQLDPAATLSGNLTDYWSLATDSGKLTTIYNVQAPSITVTGKLSVGLLAFDDIEASITSLTGTVTVNGDFVSTGAVTAQKYNVDTTSVLGASLGKAIIPAGQTELVIITSAVSSNSAIFVTPEIYALPVATESTQAGKFVIRLPFDIPDDLKVNWWIIN